MKYDGIVLYTDLDGTLLDANRQLSEENLAAVKYFIACGGSFGVATGRMERTTLIKFPQLPTNIPSIFLNGALTFDTQKEEIIHSAVMPEGLEAIFKHVRNLYPDCGVEINVPAEAYVIHYNDIIDTQLKREGIKGKITSWENVPNGWLKVLLADRHQKLEEIDKYLKSLNRRDINITFSEYELLDIMANGVSKGAALKKQREINKDKWKLIFAIGDNDNDEDMIKNADVGIAVSNATPKVKKAADYIVSHHSISCMPQVLDIINRYIN